MHTSIYGLNSETFYKSPPEINSLPSARGAYVLKVFRYMGRRHSVFSAFRGYSVTSVSREFRTLQKGPTTVQNCLYLVQAAWRGKGGGGGVSAREQSISPMRHQRNIATYNGSPSARPPKSGYSRSHELNTPYATVWCVL
jgi:hypothetical protein